MKLLFFISFILFVLPLEFDFNNLILSNYQCLGFEKDDLEITCLTGLINKPNFFTIQESAQRNSYSGDYNMTKEAVKTEGGNIVLSSGRNPIYNESSTEIYENLATRLVSSEKMNYGIYEMKINLNEMFGFSYSFRIQTDDGYCELEFENSGQYSSTNNYTYTRKDITPYCSLPGIGMSLGGRTFTYDDTKDITIRFYLGWNAFRVTTQRDDETELEQIDFDCEDYENLSEYSTERRFCEWYSFGANFWNLKPLDFYYVIFTQPYFTYPQYHDYSTNISKIYVKSIKYTEWNYYYIAFSVFPAAVAPVIIMAICGGFVVIVLLICGFCGKKLEVVEFGKPEDDGVSVHDENGITMQRFSSHNITNFMKSQSGDTQLSFDHLDEVDPEVSGILEKMIIDKRNFVIDVKDIKLLAHIGEGGSGCQIYKANWKGQLVALKTFKIKFLSKDENYSEFQKELAIMSNIHHPSIIQSFGATLVNPRIGIVLEYCSNGDLEHYVFKLIKKDIEFPFSEKLRIINEIVNGMEYLHDRKLIHRDLKCKNVLLDKSIHAKIIDFGTSRILEKVNSGFTKMIGTSYYMAPELCAGYDYDHKVDVFSFAIVVWNLLYEDFRPYGKDVTFNVELRVSSNPDFRPKVDSSTPKWITNLMVQCWDADPDSRPSFNTIRKLIKKNKYNKDNTVKGKAARGSGYTKPLSMRGKKPPTSKKGKKPTTNYRSSKRMSKRAPPPHIPSRRSFKK